MEKTKFDCDCVCVCMYVCFGSFGSIDIRFKMIKIKSKYKIDIDRKHANLERRYYYEWYI